MIIGNLVGDAPLSAAIWNLVAGILCVLSSLGVVGLAIALVVASPTAVAIAGLVIAIIAVMSGVAWTISAWSTIQELRRR
jgi:hypothetical protein